MRNLKKFSAAILSVAIIASSMTAAFAAPKVINADKASILKKLDLYVGKDAKNPAIGLEDVLTTEQALTLLAKLFGYKDSAEKLTAAEVNKELAKFADNKDISDYAKKIVAYSSIHNILSGSPSKDGRRFYVGAKDTVSGARFGTFILKQMGHKVPDFKKSLAQLAGVDGSKIDKIVKGNLSRDEAVGIIYGILKAKTATGKTVISDIIGIDLPGITLDLK